MARRSVDDYEDKYDHYHRKSNIGSAGREIGSKVAEAFGIKLYDKEMLARAAKESGICEEIFETT